MKKNSKLLAVLGNLDLLVASIALIILIVTTFLGVPMRYLVNRPFTWLEEVQSACLVWIVFGAAGAAFRTGNHVAIEMIVDRFPKKVQQIFQIFISIVVVGVIGFLLIQSFGFIQMFIKSGRTTAILHLPYRIIYLICPVSFVLQIVSYLATTVRDWDKIGETQKMEGVD